MESGNGPKSFLQPPADASRKFRAGVQRAVALRDGTFCQKSLVEYVEEKDMVHDTDSRSKPLLETLPLKVRAQYQASRWPANREVYPKLMPPSRNMSTIWRRYPNGEVDVAWAYGKLSEAINRHALGIALNENDALAISSVFPEVKFRNLPKGIVDIKATLSSKERERIQGMVSCRLREALFGKDRSKE